MDSTRAGAVTITRRRLWQIRAARGYPRLLLSAMAVAGVTASVRFALAPPRAPSPPALALPSAGSDRAAEGFATLFARRYLTWNATDPFGVEQALEAVVGSSLEPGAGLRLPASGSQSVEWVEVVGERVPAPGEHVYTLAVQTDTAGLLYLTVPVVRNPDGRLALAGYPAFVGPPAFESARAPSQLRELAEPSLATVVERALRNYLAASFAELAADLTSGARVSMPTMPLVLDSTARLDWSADGRSIVALVLVHDSRGVRYTLAYELDVVRDGTRWEISAVQISPSA